MPVLRLKRLLRPLPILCMLLIFVGGLVLTFWTSQWWLPEVAPALLGRFDVKVNSVARTEGGRMRLEGLSYEGSGELRVELDYVELPSLWDYANGRWLAAEWSDSQRIELGALALQLGVGEDSKEGDKEIVDSRQIASRVNREVARLQPWLPPITLEKLTVTGQDRETVVRSDKIRLSGKTLEAFVYAKGIESAIPVVLSLDSGAWSLQSKVSELSLELEARLEHSADRLLLSGQLLYDGQQLSFQADWQNAGLMPDAAALEADSMVVREEHLDLTGLTDIQSLRFRQADLRWDGQRYQGDFEIEADGEVDGFATEAVGVVAFEGDLEGLRIHSFDIDTPWVEAALDSPLAIRFSELSLKNSARFLFSADLSRQPFLPLGGTVRGRVSLQHPAQATFDLDGQDVAYEGNFPGNLSLSGSVDQAGLHFNKFEFTASKPAQAEIVASGRMDFQKSNLDYEYSGSVSPEFAETLGLPPWLRDTIGFKGSLRGEVDNPELLVEWNAPAIKPDGMPVIAASGIVAKTQKGPIRVDLMLINSGEQIDMALDFMKNHEGDEMNGVVRRFLWKANGDARLELLKTSSFKFSPNAGSVPMLFDNLMIEGIFLSGADAELNLEKQEAEPLSLSLHGLQTEWLDPWVEKSLPSYGIHSADLNLTQLSPCLAGGLSLSVKDNPTELGHLRFDLQELRFGEKVELPLLSVFLDGQSLVEASAVLPFRLNWSEGERLIEPKLRWDDPIQMRAKVESSGGFSRLIRQFSGITVESPRLDLEIDGSMEKPSGHIEASADSIQLMAVPSPLGDQTVIPDFKKAEFRTEFDGQVLRLTKMKAAIRGGLVEGSGQWPVETWREFELAEPDWFSALQRGTYELSVSDWELENWTPYLPAMLRRSGMLSGSLRHIPDSGFEGSLSFKDFGLRPTQNLPSVDSASGYLTFDGQSIKVERAGARVGGSPVSLLGKLDFADWPDLSWQAEVKGKNVPIVRRSDMILRSDLDLKLNQERGKSTPELAGRMGLRSSTMLVEFDPLSPAVRSGPSAKPPFFAIEEEPFNQWDLDLRIEGERFLRVRSPYFQAVLSAGLDLTGRLGEPMLLGSIRIDEGSLSFPGGKMRMDSGEAFIESAQPDALQIDMTGIAKTGAHVITMDVSGTLADPQIQFDASPPLPNASIVRLLSTGSTTGGGAGSVGLYLGRGLLGAGGMNESFADRLTIDVGEETTRSGKNTLGVRYDVSEEVYLQSEYDVYDSYNTDLLWTIYEK